MIDSLHTYINSIHPISDEEFKAFVSIFTPLELKKKEYFSKEGARENRLGILTKGIMRTFITDKRGTEYNKHLFKPFDTVGGYSSLITSKPNQLNYQALTDCIIFVAPYTEMLKLYDEYRNIERLAKISLEHQFVIKEKREIDLLTMDATERYLEFSNDFPGVEQLIPLQHIAYYIGVTPTQLSRIRKSLL